ncbi:MAG: YeeE/YedE family protein [Notoacmeibacter sp.]|nr:YeeE/YedE family protein [Notoacmeibacter sp.]
MDLSALADTYSEPVLAAFGALVIGFLFGAFAQKSRFCLRAAAVDFSRGNLTGKVAVWLLVFGTALAATQLLSLLDLVNIKEARQLASPQSLSGAALGGLLFGSGMVLARGCASRLLVLSATGNLRALLSGLVFAVVAQASLHGFLSPLRNAIAGTVTSNAVGGNDILEFTGISTAGAIVFSLIWLSAGLWFAWRNRTSILIAITAVATGLMIPLAWWYTAQLSSIAFEPVNMTSLTFTGPSAKTLMHFLEATELDFDVGLVPGVFLGSFLAAAVSGELKLQGWNGGHSMRRYIAGAAMMGFGGMLAGGCAVGAGVTGGSVFALTAWVTLGAMWLAAGLTDRMFDYGVEVGQVPAKDAGTELVGA